MQFPEQVGRLDALGVVAQMRDFVLGGRRVTSRDCRDNMRFLPADVALGLVGGCRKHAKPELGVQLNATRAHNGGAIVPVGRGAFRRRSGVLQAATDDRHRVDLLVEVRQLLNTEQSHLERVVDARRHRSGTGPVARVNLGRRQQ